MSEKEKKVCGLCGGNIEHTKGQPKKAHEYELQQGAHIVCLRAQQTILSKHNISPNDYLNAVIEGIFLLSPELDETKSVRGYRSRVRKAEEEIVNVFPYLKKNKEGEKKAEEKKQGEGKGGKDKC